MRLTILIMTIAFMQVAAKGLGQTVSISASNVPIEKVFKSIEQQTGYNFVCFKEDMQKIGNVTVRLVKVTLSEALDMCLKNKPFTYVIDDKNIIIKPVEIVSGDNEQSQLEKPALNITGHVFAADQTPLSGVNITLKGASGGTTTDVNGKFAITVPSNKTILVVSSVGYVAQEVALGGQTDFTIILQEDIKKLNEVVVVGYGQQSRKNVTGSVTKVDMAKTENLPATSFTQALRGRVAGVQFTDNGRPGQNGTAIQIRGQRTLSGNSSPMIILDGVFFSGDYSDIDPNDIESMEILKDASATAIYGSRAANGVILITTRKGTSAKPTILFNTFYGLSDWSYKMKLYTADNYPQRILDYLKAFNQPSDPTKITDYLQTTERERYLAGQTVDPWSVVSQNSNIQSYNLNVSGKTERTSYYMSGTYVKDKGLILNDNAKRISVRSNVTTRITDWLDVGMNSQFTRRDMSGVRPPIDMAYTLSPYAKLYYDDAQTRLVPYPVVDQLQFNPLLAPQTQKNEVINYNLLATMYAVINVPFIKGLSYRFNYNASFLWNHNYSLVPIYNTAGTGYLNTGSAQKFNEENKGWQTENILSYNKQISPEHAFDVTLLYGGNGNKLENTKVTSTNLFNDANGYNNLGIGVSQQAVTQASKTAGISYMARLNYRFKQRYLLTLTARRDGSSTFGENHKYGTFPSAALAWVVSDESFMKKLPVFNLLKARVSYGSVGNIAGNPYQSLGQFATTQYVFGDGSSTYTGVYPNPLYMPNPLLGWETTVGTNMAIDFQLFKDRIGGTIEYYSTKTNDLLQAQSVSPMTGFSNQYFNIGQTSNKGLELTLNTVNIKKGLFEWSSNIVFSTNRNRIVHLKYQDANKDGIEDNDVLNGWFIGKPIGALYDYVFDGIYQVGETLPAGYKPGWIRVKDITNDGKITPDDRTVIGQRDPKYRWGIANNFQYGSFSLSFFVNAMQGFMSSFNMLDVSNSTKGGGFPGRPLNMLSAGYWTAENKSTTRPGLNFTNPLGINYYVKRDFIRLQDVSMAYNFSRAVTGYLGLKTLQVYVSGRNLYTKTDWPGPDPESGSNNIPDLYPTPRTISFGVRISL